MPTDTHSRARARARSSLGNVETQYLSHFDRTDTRALRVHVNARVHERDGWELQRDTSEARQKRAAYSLPGPRERLREEKENVYLYTDGI